MDKNVWDGVQSLLDDYAKLRPDDTAVIVYSQDSYESAAWVSVALEMRNIQARWVSMIPLRDPQFCSRLNAALPHSRDLHGRLVLFSFERDTMSHDRVIRDALRQYDEKRCLVFRSISSSTKLFSDALRVSPTTLSALNSSLLNRLMSATSLRIETTGGSSLRVSLDSEKYRWISNRGTWRPGHFVILPAGEVATFPASIEGTLVADFAFNVNAITDRDARLGKNPVTVEIRENRAVNYSCEDLQTQRFLDECFHKHCAFNVGELGFGTNIRVETADMLNSHVNERCPGVHLGFGQHNQGSTIGYQCNIHLDLIARGGLVWIDDNAEPIDLENIVPTEVEHPDHSRDEDVFSPELDDLEIDDCCGVLTSEGIKVFNLDLEVEH